ncbi:MAG: hypothetical protein ACRDRO_03280 [Pseudonocardiaceae bacterium]
MSPNDPLRGALRDVLIAAVESGPGAVGGVGSLQCQVFATLYALLGAHPVDGRGRCWSCRRPGAVLGFRRRYCRVHGEASVWLQEPEWFLRSRLIRELGLTDLPPAQGSTNPTAAGDVGGDTDVVPRIEPDLSDPRSEPFLTPTVSPPLPPRRLPRVGRSDPTTRCIPGRSPAITLGIP